MSLKIGPKPVGLAAKMAAKNDALAKTGAFDFKSLNPEEMAERLGIVFDDSGSMSGQAILDAHAGVEEFLRNCKPGQTSVTIYPMNAERIKLSCDLITLSILVHKIEATGGTPLVQKLLQMMRNENIKRAIVFSDGSPNNTYLGEVIPLSKEKKIPVDTVYIGPDLDTPISFMRGLAEATGGVFLHFDPKKTNFRTAFKYLTPGYYGMLSSSSFRNDLEQGRKA